MIKGDTRVRMRAPANIGTLFVIHSADDIARSSAWKCCVTRARVSAGIERQRRMRKRRPIKESAPKEKEVARRNL